MNDQVEAFDPLVSEDVTEDDGERGEHPIKQRVVKPHPRSAAVVGAARREHSQ